MVWKLKWLMAWMQVLQKSPIVRVRIGFRSMQKTLLNVHNYQKCITTLLASTNMITMKLYFIFTYSLIQPSSIKRPDKKKIRANLAISLW